MALIMNDYRPTNMAGTIRRHECREHTHSRISGSTPYPSVASLVRRMEDPNRGQDALSEFYNSDALFRFTIGAAADIRERVARRVQQQGQDRVVGDPQMHRLLMLGVFDWTGEDIFRGGQNFPSLAFRYSCVLGNSLLKRIERSDAEVRLPDLLINFLTNGTSRITGWRRRSMNRGRSSTGCLSRRSTWGRSFVSKG